VDDRALATALAEGHLDGLLAVHDAYADRLFDYGFGLLGSEDAAIGAIRDALLIASEHAAARPTGVVDDESRLAARLYALTRNECVRRQRNAGGADLNNELLVLAHRHELPLADIAAILGMSADDVTHRLRLARAAGTDLSAAAAPAAAPAALRAQLAAGLAADAAEYRAALVRRAGPFGPDGFPQPLDQRRIGGHVLAWCTAAAVLIALAVLVMLPTDDSSAGPAALAGGLLDTVRAETPSLASAGQPPFATRDAWPLPQAETLQPTTTVAVPPAVPDASTGAGAATTPPPASTTVPRPPVNPLPPAADGPDTPVERSALAAWFQNRTAPSCTAHWTARVHAAVVGPAADAVTRVTGTWADSGQVHSVVLQRSDREWVATVGSLPTNRDVTLTMRAGGAGGVVASGATRLQYHCS
jgi:hypothetical protein